MPVSSPYPLVSIDHALAAILRHSPALGNERVPLIDALGRVLAVDLTAPAPVPPFPAAAKDGFAVIAADAARLRRLAGEQMAGRAGHLRVEPGTVVRITTGAVIPAGADAVVMVEHTSETNGWVEIETTVSPGADIRPPGQDIAAGERVLNQGAVLGPAEIGLLASVGLADAPVFRRPRVGVLSTGDELVEPGAALASGQIYDSNRFSLAAAVAQAGGVARTYGIVADTPAALAAFFESALAENDVLVTSGGVSMGKLDLLKPLLEERGTVHFGRVIMKPGKPVTFATIAGKPVFSLPGFPVSALVSFELFVRPALRQMQGDAAWQRPRLQVALAHDLQHDAHRTEYQRARVFVEDGRFLARTTGHQGSGRLLSMAGANALLELTPGDDFLPAGAMTTALLLHPIGA
ncbi:MAG: molybdopterin molybdotransferase MoeA [Caldilineales bacterium]|nr:molybdopterin molybdotransferase MoeA [Caldilineales bacterium]MCW5857399.1 molybdopterin molybdotransferase MoeA [Caldilineales bacterium]